MPAIELVDFKSIKDILSTYTFDGCNLGDPADDRYIVVSTGAWRGNSTIAVSNITVAGAATAAVAGATSGLACTALRVTSSPLVAGASGTIVVDFTNSARDAWVAVWRVERLASIVPHDTGSFVSTASLSGTVNVDVPAAGIVVASSLSFRGANNSRLGSAAHAAVESETIGFEVTATHGVDGVSWPGLVKAGDADISYGTFNADWCYLCAASLEILPVGTGAASGASEASGEGGSTARAGGLSSGESDAAAEGRADSRAAAMAQGEAVAYGAGRSLARGSGAAAGVASASAEGVVPRGSAAGAATAAAAGAADVRGDGVASASAAAVAASAARGISQSMAAAPAVGRSLARGTGFSAATAGAAGFPPPSGIADGAASVSAEGRADHRAAAAAVSTSSVLAKGQAVRRFFVTADGEGSFDFDYAGELPPGSYVARARASDAGETTGWSDPVTVEVAA